MMLPGEGGLSEAEAVAILRGINALMADIDASDGEGGVFSHSQPDLRPGAEER